MRDAGSDAFNAVQHHPDGTASIRSGFVPIEIAGVELPHRGDPERLANRDIYAMDRNECAAESGRIAGAIAAMEELRAQGVRDVTILKALGATSFEEWAEDRRKEIAKRLLYGR